MDGRKDLLMAWLEGEGERQYRLILPIPNAYDFNPRGWVQVGVCVIGGALVAGLFACWLVTAWNQANQVTCQEHLYEVAFRMKAEHPEWQDSAFNDPEARAWFEERLREERGSGQEQRGRFWGFAVLQGVCGCIWNRDRCAVPPRRLPPLQQDGGRRIAERGCRNC